MNLKIVSKEDKGECGVMLVLGKNGNPHYAIVLIPGESAGADLKNVFVGGEITLPEVPKETV